ncbi:hypothetical protein PTKIN_Ptkin13bG0241700 [Pterospermum kingtungense]
MMSITAKPLKSKRLEGKVALITGGSSHSLCTELGTPDSICYTHCDVTCETDVEKAVDLAVSKYGKLDMMFNNAGIAGEFELRAVASDAEDFKKVLDINVYGGFLGAKHAARAIIPAKSGCILFTSSVSSLLCIGVPHAYTTSKHAVVGLSKSLSVELGEYGIRVNCISPHAIATPLLLSALGVSDKRKAEEVVATNAVLKGTILEPEDVAQAALFLASDEAKYLNGVNLPVDGGYSLNNQAWKKGLEELK